MSFDFSTLIIDRSQSDVETARELTTRVENGLATAEEIARWNLAAEKGAYNYTDLNRVTACMDYLNERLTGYGYATGYERIKVHPESPSPEKPIPDGYTQLEYIESTGSQYIDTGFKPSGSSRIVCDFQPLSTGMWIYGARHAASDRTFMTVAMSDNYRSDYNNSYSLNIQYDMSLRVTIDKNKGSMTIGNQTVSYSNAVFVCEYNLYIFAGNSAGIPSTFSKMKLYSCKIYDDNILVRDFIPCKNKTGAVGLYDTVNGVFYSNSGTGTFLAGPEVEQSEQPKQPETELDPYTWYEEDTPTESLMNGYIGNIEALRSTLEMIPTTPQTPASMEALTWAEANNIEQILIDIEIIITSMSRVFIRSGTTASGGPGFYFVN